MERQRHEEGREEALIENIKKMNRKGMNPSDISSMLDLDIEYVNNVLNKQEPLGSLFVDDNMSRKNT